MEGFRLRPNARLLTDSHARTIASPTSARERASVAAMVPAPLSSGLTPRSVPNARGTLPTLSYVRLLRGGEPRDAPTDVAVLCADIMQGQWASR